MFCRLERTYLYVTNLQGDVLSVVDSVTGQTAVSYVYDAWGKLISKSGTSSDYASIYEYNPLTYRGYIYDSETGFYYLQSRYYDPTVGRFLNADDVQSIGSILTSFSQNMFSYCKNNPINHFDPSGNEAIVIAGVTISAVALIAIVLVIFFFAYTFDRNFRNAINELIYGLISGISKVFESVARAISQAIAKAKTSTHYRGTEIHHIVARTDIRALPGRELLWSYGMDVEDSYNKVSVSKTIHKHLHTTSYHYAVFDFLKAVESKGRTYIERKNKIIAGLIYIGTILSISNSFV